MSNLSNDVWRPTSAWAGTPLAARRSAAGNGSPITLTPYGHIDMAALIVADDRADSFAAAVRQVWNLEVPAAGRASLNGRNALLYVAPDQYLIYVPDGLREADLRRDFDGIAAVSLQGDGRAVVGIAGESSRTLLNKGISLDLHPSVFHAGCCAGTALAHGAVQLVQISETPEYLLLVPRTVAGSIAEWLLEAAAEYGYDVKTDPARESYTRAA